MNIIINGTTVSPKASSIEFAHCMSQVNIYWDNIIAGTIRAEGGKIIITYADAMTKYPRETGSIMQNLISIFEAEMTQYYTPPVVEEPVVETPVVETPVVETPVVETPVVEEPVVEEPVV